MPCLMRHCRAFRTHRLIYFTINRVNGKTVGDVDFEAVSEIAGAITPVPGGVGSVTTTMVIENIITAGEKQAAKEMKD